MKANKVRNLKPEDELEDVDLSEVDDEYDFSATSDEEHEAEERLSNLDPDESQALEEVLERLTTEQCNNLTAVQTLRKLDRYLRIAETQQKERDVDEDEHGGVDPNDRFSAFDREVPPELLNGTTNTIRRLHRWMSKDHRKRALLRREKALQRGDKRWVQIYNDRLLASIAAMVAKIVRISAPHVFDDLTVWGGEGLPSASVNRDDLVQEGLVAAIEAISRYVPDRGGIDRAFVSFVWRSVEKTLMTRKGELGRPVIISKNKYAYRILPIKKHPLFTKLITSERVSRADAFRIVEDLNTGYFPASYLAVGGVVPPGSKFIKGVKQLNEEMPTTPLKSGKPRQKNKLFTVDELLRNYVLGAPELSMEFEFNNDDGDYTRFGDLITGGAICSDWGSKLSDKALDEVNALPTLFDLLIPYAKPDEMEVIRCRFTPDAEGEFLSRKDVGAQFGLKDSGVRKIETKVFTAVRKACSNDPELATRFNEIWLTLGGISNDEE